MRLLKGLRDKIELDKRVEGIVEKVKQYGVLFGEGYFISLNSVKEHIPELSWLWGDELKKLNRKLDSFAVVGGRELDIPTFLRKKEEKLILTESENLLRKLCPENFFTYVIGFTNNGEYSRKLWSYEDKEIIIEHI